MESRAKALLVEIHASGPNGASERSSGYPVAPGRILTARHGLLPNVDHNDKTIQVRWHQQPKDDPSREWRPATICWNDEGLDAALLRCEFPVELEQGRGWISAEQPREDARWSAVGIPRAGDQDAETSGPFHFHGGVYSASDTEDRFDIGVEDAAEGWEWWEGASGMAIFVERRIIGIAVSCREATQARRFRASPTWKMLEDPAFRQAIGYDERKERREAAETALVTAIMDGSAVRKVLGNLLGVALRDPQLQSKKIAKALLDLPVAKAIEALDQAQQGLGGDHCSDQDRQALAKILGVVMPVLFDEGVQAGVRAQLERSPLLELPVGIETVAEVVMAGARGRPAQFGPRRDRDAFPRGLAVLPLPPEGGFDADGRQFERDLETDLQNRLGQGEEGSFDALVVDTVVKEADIMRQDGITEGDLIAMAQDELKEQARRHKVHYYFILRLPQLGDRVEAVMGAVDRLKGRYPEIDFVVLAHASDGEVLRQERRRFGPLRYILP